MSNGLAPKLSNKECEGSVPFGTMPNLLVSKQSFQGSPHGQSLWNHAKWTGTKTKAKRIPDTINLWNHTKWTGTKTSIPVSVLS